LGVSGECMSQINVNEIYDGNGTDSAKLYGVSMRYGGTGWVNRIINGDMRIDQRNAGAAVTSGFPVDRWKQDKTTGASFSYQRNAGGVAPPAGFTNYLGCTSTDAYPPATNTTVTIRHYIEGFNTADFAWGTTDAKTVTLSFWVRTSVAGAHSGHVSGAGALRAYVFSFTVSSANTWEYKTITIPGDTSGTWVTDNGLGALVGFNLGTGTGTFGTTTTGWQAGNLVGLTTAVQVSATNGATLYITGVQLEAGSVATPFERRPYGTELALCQRYYYRIFSTYFANSYNATTAAVRALLKFPVTMRASPTTLEQSGTATDYQVTVAGASINCSVVPAFDSASTENATYTFTVASGLTSGQGSITRPANVANGFLAWSAEL
jgi:hypothetical protein